MDVLEDFLESLAAFAVGVGATMAVAVILSACCWGMTWILYEIYSRMPWS